MRTTVDIDAHLLKRLRVEARRRGVPFKEYLNGVLHRALHERREAPAESYRCPAFGMGAPLRPLDKALSLADALDDEDVVRDLALRK